MKKSILFAAGLALVATSAFAGRSCDDVKAEIAAKVEKKGVKAYSLEVVKKGEEGDRRVVGNCESGRKIIVYKRG
jgi:hypothetical protein